MITSNANDFNSVPHQNGRAKPNLMTSAGDKKVNEADGQSMGNKISDVYNVSNFPVRMVACTEWKKNGKCAYGAQCRFGHPVQVSGCSVTSS